MNHSSESDQTKIQTEKIKAMIQAIGDATVTQRLGDDLSATMSVTINGRHLLQGMTMTSKFFINVFSSVFEACNITPTQLDEKLEEPIQTLIQMMVLLVNNAVEEMNKVSAQKMSELTADLQLPSNLDESDRN